MNKRILRRHCRRPPTISSQPTTPYKPNEFRKRGWRRVTKFTRSGDALNGDETDYEVTGLVVRFRFTRTNKGKIKEIPERPISSPSTSPTSPTSPTSNSFGSVQSSVADQDRIPPMSS